MAELDLANLQVTVHPENPDIIYLDPRLRLIAEKAQKEQSPIPSLSLEELSDLHNHIVTQGPRRTRG